MKKYIGILKNTKLFSGVDEAEIKTMLTCLGARKEGYKKGEYIYRSGEHIRDISILLEGKLHIQKDDYWGNRSIISRVEKGDMFGEAYTAPDCGEFPGDVVAEADSVVAFFDIQRILTVCSSGCRFHSLTVKNLFFAISERNRALVSKIGYMSTRSTRGKLLAYLSDAAKQAKSASFEIPFNRQQLADYLAVDRSAMSNELCKMRDEGILEFEKNRFVLK